MRHADESDLQEIEHALWQLTLKSPAPHMKHADLAIAMRSIVDAIKDGDVFVFGDYMLKVSTGSPWWSNTPMLFEDMILRIKRTKSIYTVADVVEGLQYIAEARGIKVVCAGDTQIGKTLDAYYGCGFTSIGSQVYKEL